MNYYQKTGLLIVLGSLLRLWVAASLELGNDEVYYQTYALHLQWNYFDHPPMLALLIQTTTGNLFLNQEFFIRLGPVLCAAAGTWLIFISGGRINGARTGWIAAILYNSSFYTSIIAGTFILPDSPEVLCWLLSIYFMIRILETGSEAKNNILFFLLLGLITGLCIMSKVHGIFLWLGFGGYLIGYRRNLLKSPMLWLSAMICLGIIFPIYWWNHENHFITYNYHQGRIRFWGKPDPDHLLQQVFGSVFYNNPVNFILYILTGFAIVKKRIKRLPEIYPLLLWLSLPLILLLLWTSLFNETLPHWSGPAYLSLMLLTACWLNEKTSRYRAAWLKTAGWVYAGIVAGGVLCIRYLPLTIGSAEGKNLGKGDITLDLSGWKSFAFQMDSIYRSDIESKRMKPGAVLISDYWFPAGHMDHYAGLPYHHNLLAFGPLTNIHHFAWLNYRRPRLSPGSDAYFVYPTNYYGPPADALKKKFTMVEDSLLVAQYRSAVKVRNFVVYRMHEFRGDSLDYLIQGIH